VVPVTTFSLLIGSPECTKCDITKREYTDGPGSTQCRTCGEEEYSTGSECKIVTRVMDAGTPDAKCDVIFWESQLDGCVAADKPFCKQAMTALFVPSPLESTEITGCGDTCKSIVDIKQGTETLYTVNLIDMIVELVALVLVACGVCYTFVNSGDLENLSMGVHFLMCCFAIADTILQIIALSTAGSIQGATQQLQGAKCLDVTNVDGLKKHDILTKLADSVGLSLILGISELVLTGIETCLNFVQAGSHEVKAMGLILVVVFQLFESTLTSIDFLAVTMEAQSQSDQLFDTQATTKTQEEWCISMVNTSTVCIAEKRGMTPEFGGGAVSAGIMSANVSMWWAGGLVLATSWWLSLKNHHGGGK
jgi:hypothetical protein